MFDCHQSEESFWRKMNPARLHALFNAYFRPRDLQVSHSPAADRRQDEPRSLSAYLMGGG